MYKINLDLIKKHDAVYIQAGAEVNLKIEDYEVEGEIKFSPKEWEKLDNEYRKEVGEKTYDELKEIIDDLKAKIEERDTLIEIINELRTENNKLRTENNKLKITVNQRENLIEQYEQYNDVRMERYFNSDGIL